MSVIIAGYYGFDNAGDELILWSLIRRFRCEAPDATITVLSKNPDETEHRFGVRAIDRWQPWTWVSPLLQANRFVLGGGGLLQESSGPWNHFYYLSLLVLAKLLGCRTEITAIGVDTIAVPFNRFWTRWVLNHWADRISVRDEESGQALRDAGVTTPLSVENDPVCELDLIRTEPLADHIALAISPSHLGDDRTEEWARLCTRIASQLRMPIDFLVFFKSEDESFSRAVAAKTIGTGDIRFWADPRDLMSWVPRYPLVVSSRFHALVLAARSDVPFVGVSDQSKVVSFCRGHQMPYSNTAAGWNEDQIMSQIAEMYQSRSKSVILAHDLIDFAR